MPFAGLSLLKELSGSVLLWPAGSIAIIATVWTFTLTKIENERHEAEQEIFALATNHSKAYAEQLEQTISHIEQLTLSLQYQWKKNSADVSLEEQLMYGMFPKSGGVHVSIIDHLGNGVTSTLPGPPLEASDTEYFKFHQASANSRLRVDGRVIYGKRAGTSILRFTRRLESVSGAFSGAIVVGVEPTHLASFNDENTLGPRDFISIRHESGELLVSEKGKDIRGQGQIHIKPPEFTSNLGTKRVSGENFKDNKARIVAWQKHKNYPLISYAGLSEDLHMASYLQRAADYRNFAIASTFFLLLTSTSGMVMSIRHRRRKQQAEEVRSVFRLATDAANEGFYMVRPLYDLQNDITDFIYEDCNEHGARLVGRSKDSLIGERLTELFPGAHKDSISSIFRVAMKTGFYEEEGPISAGGPIKATWIYWRLVRSGKGLAVTIRDISEKKKHELTLLDMANTDSLTGLPNRHWLLNFLPAALSNAKSRSSLLAILFIDLDGFKDINDSLGHSAGDSLLQVVSARLKSLLRPNDHVVRLGGDEFTIVLTSVTSQEEISQVALRINQSFNKPFQITAHNGLMHASIGISTFPQDGETAEMLLQKADIAMYAAKEEAKGSFRFYNNQFYDRLRDRLQTEGELAQAILEDQFVLHYQPRVDTQTGKLVGLEALVRWLHPARGMVPPNEFIPLAENTGAIIPLGELILKKTCAQLASWRTQGEPIVPISVNISARQFNAGGVDRLIAALLHEHDLTPQLLEVELTESAMTNETGEIFEQVAAINAMGITIHVDDFGTGYSSLARLQEFNMHVLKIDRAFTARLDNGEAGKTLFKSIVSMGKALNMRIVAEGVETQGQLEILQRLQCDEVQGYFFSRPLPPESVLPLIRKRYFFQSNVQAELAV